MAVTLAQAAALEPSPLRRGTMQMFSQVSTVFDRLPLESINGAAYAYSKDKVLPGTAFRTVNEAYVESTGLVNQDTESLVIFHRAHDGLHPGASARRPDPHEGRVASGHVR